MENEATPNLGLISEVKAYCKESELPDVSRIQLKKEDIKEMMKTHYFRRMWMETLKSLKVQCNWDDQMTATRGYSWLTKLRSQLVFSLKVGKLNLSFILFYSRLLTDNNEPYVPKYKKKTLSLYSLDTEQLLMKNL